MYLRIHCKHFKIKDMSQKELTVTEQFQKALLAGGPELDNLQELLTGSVYDNLLRAGFHAPDLDKLWDTCSEAVKNGLSQWAAGNTEVIVTSLEAERQDKDMKEAAPGLDTHKLRNDPNDNLALAGRAEWSEVQESIQPNDLTPEEKKESRDQLVGPNVTSAAKELGEKEIEPEKKSPKKKQDK